MAGQETPQFRLKDNTNMIVDETGLPIAIVCDNANFNYGKLIVQLLNDFYSPTEEVRR